MGSSGLLILGICWDILQEMLIVFPRKGNRGWVKKECALMYLYSFSFAIGC